MKKEVPKIAIVGYGVEGRACADYFEKKGYNITVCDQKYSGPLKSPTQKLRSGADYLKNLHEFDLVFRSPGVPYLLKEFKPVREKLTSLTKYFFENCPCPIVGVTGTKGKGTTATLIYEMLKDTKKGKVFLGGNIGTPPLTFLDALKPDDTVILELSSFQLEDMTQSPHVAVVLGITPDHLDHHQNFDEYVTAKKNIVKFQKKSDFAVIDMDNAVSARFAEAGVTAAKKLFVSSAKSTITKNTAGAFVKVSSLVIKRGATGMIFGERGAVGLIGEHNIKNLLAAAAATELLGAPIEAITKVSREFRGLPHRLQLVRDIDGARYYDDSASTNPETTIAALRAFHQPTILIVGGSDKNVSFQPLGDEIARRLNVKTVVLMGQTKGKIESAVEMSCAQEQKRIVENLMREGQPVRHRDIPLELIAAESYQEAFMVARLLAQPGDVVLLSPGCASFDMFTDYKERGEIFNNFVNLQ